MKPLLRLIKGGKPERMKFASFGRERDIEFIERYMIPTGIKAQWIRQTNAAHDLNEGTGTLDAFIDATRDAIFNVTPAGRDAPLTLMSRIAVYHPQCLRIWFELAKSSKWDLRFDAACRLYWDVSEAPSNCLFNDLPFDRSRKVREIACSRYRDRADPKGRVIENMYDPEGFDERVASGEIKIEKSEWTTT